VQWFAGPASGQRRLPTSSTNRSPEAAYRAPFLLSSPTRKGDDYLTVFYRSVSGRAFSPDDCWNSNCAKNIGCAAAPPVPPPAAPQPARRLSGRRDAVGALHQRRRLLETEGSILVRAEQGPARRRYALAKACADLPRAGSAVPGKPCSLALHAPTVARVAEQATATIPREQLARIEINTYHGLGGPSSRVMPTFSARKPASPCCFRPKLGAVLQDLTGRLVRRGNASCSIKRV